MNWENVSLSLSLFFFSHLGVRAMDGAGLLVRAVGHGGEEVF
jgi:hypothetical protein